MDPLSEYLTAAGWATWNIEYRRLGNPGGGWPGTFLDVALALDHLRYLAEKNPLDLNDVTALGHSAGGHLALWLAGRHHIPSTSPLYCKDPLSLRGVVSLAGVADLHQAWEMKLGGGIVKTLLGGTPEEVPDRYAAASPAALLPLGGEWQILVHGAKDTIVPPEVSTAFLKASKAKGNHPRLLELADAGHFEVIQPAAKDWSRIRDSIPRGRIWAPPKGLRD
jgi:acetyl esterase/lipase